MIKIYSNYVRARITPAELVLEFSTFLPSSEEEQKRGVPENHESDVQVIMNANQLFALADSFKQMAERVRNAAAHGNTTTQNPMTPGKARA